jgi:hypothetical protein
MATNSSSPDISFIIVISLIFCISLYFIITNLKFKKEKHTLNLKEVTDDTKFHLITKINDKMYFIGINKANMKAILTRNEKQSCLFEIVTNDSKNKHKKSSPLNPENDNDISYFNLKDRKTNYFMNFSYPETFNKIYDVIFDETEETFNTLLKFNFNIKHKMFSIKFHNDMYLCYNKHTMELVCCNKNLKDNNIERLFVLIETL